jgi:G3E family GTPase
MGAAAAAGNLEGLIMDAAAERLPVSVLTGFLGSGKTTLLARLLKHPQMGETAVVINEFGEVGLDHALVARASEDVVLLDSGCLCCTVRGDLVTALRDLFLKRVRQQVPEFRRVVIETSGLADPAPILQTLMSDPLLSARYALDGVIATVDAMTGAATLDRQPESVKQAAMADRLLLTKTDLAPAHSVAMLERRLHRLNPAAPPLRVTFGAIAPDSLFNAGLYDPERKSPDVRRWLHEAAYAPPAPSHDHHHDDGHEHEHEHDHAHDLHRHDDRIGSFCLTFDRPLDWDRVARAFDLLAAQRGEDLLRVKGILAVQGTEQPVVIHGVQHLFHPPVLLDAWPDDDRRSKIVFITRDLPQPMIEGMLRALLEDEAPAG